jgi:molybdate transport system ATP-binding protein
MDSFFPEDLFLELDNISFQVGQGHVIHDFKWKIMNSQNWAIVGPVGSGKSLLAEAIMGNYLIKQGNIKYHFIPPTNEGYRNISKYIAYISFSENSNGFSYSKHYYQQRFNATESEDCITVAEYLNEEVKCDISEMFGLEELLQRQFIKLSNGQTRKVRIVKALSKNPKLLILDDPFIGLDAESRNLLESIINKLPHTGTKIILITNRTLIPACITHVLEMDNFEKTGISTRSAFLEKHQSENTVEEKHKIQELLNLTAPQNPDFEIAAQFNGVNISYGDKKILKNLNWTIKKGEKWALLGHNGAGKSTLLSLITADNPQAYSQDIVLFDRKRGTGESIWEIKKRIGFISPELHLYFRSDMNCKEVAATGFVNTLFLNRTLKDSEDKLLSYLFDYFEISELEEKTFLRISTGQQRLILFIRAVVKNPVLFILDEPFQGMDHITLKKCQNLLKWYCTPTKTIIFVSHIREEIPDFIDKVYLLNEGEGSLFY